MSRGTYARDNELLGLDGWDRFKRLAKKQKQLYRTANKAKFKEMPSSAPDFNYVEVPRDYKHAIWRVKREDTTSEWSEVINLELNHLDERTSFMGIDQVVVPGDPDGPMMLACPVLVHRVKRNKQRKTRAVTDSSTRSRVKYREYKAHLSQQFREAIAGSVASFFRVLECFKPAVIVIKYYGYQQVWQLLQPLHSWQHDRIGIGTTSPRDADSDG